MFQCVGWSDLKMMIVMILTGRREQVEVVERKCWSWLRSVGTVRCRTGKDEMDTGSEWPDSEDYNIVSFYIRDRDIRLQLCQNLAPTYGPEGGGRTVWGH